MAAGAGRRGGAPRGRIGDIPSLAYLGGSEALFRRPAHHEAAASGSLGEIVSDLDIVVPFAPTNPTQHTDAHLGLVLALEDLSGRTIDVTACEAIHSARFGRSFEAREVTLYEAR